MYLFLFLDAQKLDLRKGYPLISLEDMDTLQMLLGKVVCVLTLEGRSLVGTLKGIDSVGNIVLENAHERTFHTDKGMQMEPMGLYLIRGDS